MKKKMLWILAACLCMTVLHWPVVIMAEEAEQGTKVEQTAEDIRVIPDKYNTGCKGELTPLMWDTENPMYVGDIFINRSGNNFVLDFGYRNLDKEGTIYIENRDFSSNPVVSYNEHKVDRQVKVVFNNCKFAKMSTGKADGNMSFEFNNCTINSYNGSNSVFNRCQFGHSYSDGVVPFVDIEVNDCFFSDMAGMISEGNVHTDGTQIYGYADLDVNNVSYNNCRFETPALHIEGSQAYVNACIMLQLEFSNAKNLSINNCIVNGGGYSIYARTKYPELTFENVGFNKIRFGAASKYGTFYQGAHESVYVNDVAPTESLYVGSVWKENGETHFSVTNDTKYERKLFIYTDAGTFEYTIPACYTSDQFTSDLTYDAFPFDMDIVVPADCQYAVCFDNTLSGCGSQIRFVNWDDGDVYLSEDVANKVYSGNADDVLVSGQCGNDVTFTLTKGGVLTLSGTGSTYNYHSAKFPEWEEYKDFIKVVRVEEGIEGLGSMIFRNCSSVRQVYLPESLTSIGQYGFAGCVSLSEFILPANITSLGKYVLSGTVLSKIHYAGDNWTAVEVGIGNDNLLERLVYDSDMAKLNAFVARLYTIALEREVDPTGHADWVGGLVNGTYDGAAVGRGVFLSPEFVGFSLTDDEFLNRLYYTFFDREPDESGKQNWKNHLDAGYTREFVLSHFVNSEEFTNLCAAFGIERGVLRADGTAVNVGVSKFVNRLYSIVMDRKPDWQGYTNWTMALVSKEQSAQQVATAFFMSTEYLNKDTSNEQYVRNLYSVFFDREPDEAGLADWISRLDAGAARESIIPGFANSDEFKEIAARYGL